MYDGGRAIVSLAASLAVKNRRPRKAPNTRPNPNGILKKKLSFV
jgi:hypothetical protein